MCYLRSTHPSATFSHPTRVETRHLTTWRSTLATEPHPLATEAHPLATEPHPLATAHLAGILSLMVVQNNAVLLMFAILIANVSMGPAVLRVALCALPCTAALVLLLSARVLPLSAATAGQLQGGGGGRRGSRHRSCPRRMQVIQVTRTCEVWTTHLAVDTWAHSHPC